MLLLNQKVIRQKLAQLLKSDFYLRLSTTMHASSKNKLSMIFLILLFITPVIVAIVMNSQWLHYSPDSFKNKGNFIQPPINITEQNQLQEFEGFWTVVYQHAGVCEEKCLTLLDTLYRIRLSQGHKMKNIKLLLLYPQGTPVDIPPQYSAMQTHTYASDDSLNAILQSLSASSLGNNRGLYLLAPEGFLMMSYGKDFKPDDVMDDLALLLRARKNEG